MLFAWKYWLSTKRNCFISYSLLLSVLIQHTVCADTLQLSILSGADDVEQRVLSGAMLTDEAELDIVTDGILAQLIGLRFQNLVIPGGATINSAALRFTASATSILSASFVIAAQAVDDAGAFTSSSFDLSNRTSTATTVNWDNVASWASAGQSAAPQTSPDLSALVQEIIDRGGWTPGNAIIFLISGSGTRRASAFEGGQAAVLDIDFELPANPQIVFQKQVESFSDPVNGTSNPKAIPGAKVLYRIIAENYGGGTADINSVVIIEAVPAGTSLYIDDISGPGSGPFHFIDGAVSSGLSYSYNALPSPLDDIDFSNNGGSSFDYVPLPDASGFDTQVTHVRINPKGILNMASDGNIPGFELQYQVQVN